MSDMNLSFRPAAFALCTVLSILEAGATANAQERAVVIEAARVMLAPGTPALEGPAARVAIRAGKIVGIGSEIPPAMLERAQRVNYADATVTAGLVSAHDYLELSSDLTEQVTAFTPALASADAFNPFDLSLIHISEPTRPY